MCCKLPRCAVNGGNNMKKIKEDTNRSTALSIRATPSVKFAADFAARLKGLSTTALVETLVMAEADKLTIAGLGWRDFDDPSPGVGWCRMYLHKIALNKDEDEIKRFVLAHREFFYDGTEPNRRRIEILWPRIGHFADKYFRTMRTSTDAAGADMNKALAEARAKQVTWPPE